MRRAGGLWEEVASYGAIRRAALRAARGKRDTFGARAFSERLEPETLRLERELRAGTWRPSPAARFRIRDPKPRTITAVPFRDRVVHHALIAPLEPVFERHMIATSYACRRGKGLHRAVARVQGWSRRYRFCLRMDVRAFFPSLEHAVVLGSLARVVKDRRVLALSERIVRGSGLERGLPIGSLTSQWFANLVLDRLDHVVKEELRVRAYARYMDDVVAFADTKRELWRIAERAGEYLAEPLHLEPKPGATQVVPSASGIPFLGFLVFPGTIRLRPDKRRRSRWRLGELAWLHARGRITDERFRRATAAVLEHLALASTRALRRSWLAPLGSEP